MPDQKTIQSNIARLPLSGPLVAVLPGGTTGIGSYVADSLARVFAEDGSKLRVYVVGRNAARAQDVIAAGKQLSPGSDWRWVQGSNLALISEVDKICAEVIRQETESPLHDTPSIDLLYMSFCVNIMQKQKITEEGLDSFLSCVYYARIRFIQQFIPLLTAGSLPGHVISIYAGSFEDGTKAGDFPVGLPEGDNWGITSVRKHTCFMKNFVFEELAQQHAGKLSLVHIYPGLVDGPVFYTDENPRWFKLIWPIMRSISSWYMTSAKDCGDVMLFLATGAFPAKESTNERAELPNGVEATVSTQGQIGGGCYAVGRNADVRQSVMFKAARLDDTSQKAWHHTIDTLGRVEKENAAKA